MPTASILNDNKAADYRSDRKTVDYVALFRMTYVKTLIQPDKYPLVYGVTFVGVAMVFAIVVLMVATLFFRWLSAPGSGRKQKFEC